MISSACFDLETSSLSGDRGVILCAVVKSSIDKKKNVYRIDQTSDQWSKGRRGDDKRLTSLIIKDLARHDIIAAHNGQRFDVPFLRTRAAHWGLPAVPNFKMVDPLQIAWRKFRLDSNSLGRIADHAGVKEHKTPLDFSIWMDAIHNGSPSAMNLIVKHCVADVDVLDAVLDVVRPYVKLFDDRGSAL